MWGVWIIERGLATRWYRGKLVSLKYSVGEVALILVRTGLLVGLSRNIKPSIVWDWDANKLENTIINVNKNQSLDFACVIISLF